MSVTRLLKLTLGTVPPQPTMNPETKITGMQTTIKIPDREIERLDKLREKASPARN